MHSGISTNSKETEFIVVITLLDVCLIKLEIQSRKNTFLISRKYISNDSSLTKIIPFLIYNNK